MKNKIISIIILLFTVTTFSGCQLAKEDLSNEKSKDKLVGIYVTYEHLDLFDMERYLNDNINKISNNGNVVLNGDNSKYNNRLYATLIENEITSSEGEKYTSYDYVFEGVEGLSMFSYTRKDPITGDECKSSISDEGICDTNYHIKSGDNSEGIELEGTIFVSSGAMENGLYFNPVYQSNDGKIYLTGGQGFIVSGDNGEGGVFSQNMEDKITITENKITTTYSINVKISIATKNPTEKIIIYQMDNDNNIILSNEYLPDNAPKEIIPENNCEYILLENHKKTFNNEKQIERQLFFKEEDYIYYFVKTNKNILNKTYTTIVWDKNDNI